MVATSTTSRYGYHDSRRVRYILTPLVQTNRLLQADGSPISTALILTCRQIAAELRGLARGQNTITFYTRFSKSTRQQAGLLNGAMYTIRHRKKMLL